MLERDLEILNSLSERDITCYVYFKVCCQPIRKIARMRNLSRGEVFLSIEKCRNYEKQESFFNLMQQMNDLFTG
ncbi:MAG: hypothetical protein CSYNP_03114 [Syntrophus sp. SKADARSKE-3]|nr:hypothetical protein [Syntrophus sp. SKADARSKE-3]